jgi:uncharacterized membrane protein YkoI
VEAKTKRLTQVMGSLGIVAGLGLGAAGLASAATSGTSAPDVSASSTNGSTASQDHQDQQDATLHGSVQVPEQQGTNEAPEAAALQTAAKITPDQAKQAALAAVPGTVNKAELDSENGSVVYSVEITANAKTTDVKVDAGNGRVLAQDSGEEGGRHEAGSEKAGNEQPDTEQPASAESSG